ncbi:M61 family metallopeptidase [Pseudoalteromonas luteoviolacea]|uniref:Peptidase M61 catalytic domain-containing protein n=1 Tax=Pseudoalteromonas luteoviolacea H33 TaxID=1365251 RepID=A0A167EH25_9GAMM|nr:hypothetical protein [Pseudoalteromonas luteoviolacea]KZN50741.1 hypothetical protein N476_15745 [Pseudoalteromonas luteoviolacea H33]KZN77685.1 hypothetical protein N477_11990 [Pseudoalteromonas luteoviolacea H33-S]MBQ4877631.1 hypothetical protein [Pseudoalteromonas luteoviolacea]MBQ4906666.1 hypothetical protein [Pseudoalteromonas luteoviolacea]
MHFAAWLACFFSSSLFALGNSAEITWRNTTPTAPHVEAVPKWIYDGLDKTVSALGELPSNVIPVSVYYMKYAKEPVPWGEVLRGEPDGITLYIDEHASLRSLIADWTLYHELAHLYHPRLDDQDSWLAEGLATYLQNVIMLKGGIISNREFVERIKAGLDRGELATKQFAGQLSQISNNMWQLKAYQRVYWSGVAFFIEAELKLQSKCADCNIVQLLARYQTCCRDNKAIKVSQSGTVFLSYFDMLTKNSVFIPLYKRYKSRRDFPYISENQIIKILNRYTKQVAVR